MTEELKTEQRFRLSQPFTYSTKEGQQVEAEFLEFSAPSPRNSKECATLKQAFFRASHSLQNDSEDTGEKPDETDEGAGIIAVIAMSTEVSLPEVMDVAAKLFTKGGVVRVDGEVKLTQPLLERMSMDDFEGALGEYLVGFILASSLALMKRSSAKG